MGRQREDDLVIIETKEFLEKTDEYQVFTIEELRQEQAFFV